MSQQFVRWLIDLDSKVGVLEDCLDHEPVEWLEKELDTCNGWLQRLFDTAVSQQIDIRQYYEQFAGIQTRLRVMKNKLTRRAEQKLSWWEKVLHFLREALAFVADILGLAPLGNLLRSPGGTSQKLLN